MTASQAQWRCATSAIALGLALTACHAAAARAGAPFSGGAVAGAGTSYPVPAKPPRFSFDTVPVFFHASKSTLYNDTELSTLLNASIVQFDKDQFGDLMPGQPFEDRATAAAKQVRDAATQRGVPVPSFLYYQNLLINFLIFEGLYNQTKAAPHTYLLYNTKGDMVYTLPANKGSQFGTFDQTKSVMRQLFVDDCVSTVEKGGFDGCFIDRGNFAAKVAADPTPFARNGWDQATAQALVDGCHAAFRNLTDALPNAIILAKEAYTTPSTLDWPYANAAMPTDTFCSDYTTQAKYNVSDCLNDILAVQAYAARGQLTESHGMGPLTDETQRTFTLACFLVAMGKLSYFSYASEQKGLAWNIDGTRWWPEFNYPLGEPLGLAVRDGMRFTRSFASGTNVTVDVKAHTASIEWATRT